MPLNDQVEKRGHYGIAIFESDSEQKIMDVLNDPEFIKVVPPDADKFFDRDLMEMVVGKTAVFIDRSIVQCFPAAYYMTFNINTPSAETETSRNNKNRVKIRGNQSRGSVHVSKAELECIFILAGKTVHGTGVEGFDWDVG